MAEWTITTNTSSGVCATFPSRGWHGMRTMHTFLSLVDEACIMGSKFNAFHRLFDSQETLSNFLLNY